MPHLPIERLAELADGEPTVAESIHLADCAMCSTERDAYRRIVALASDERRRIAPPVSNWGALREQLRAEGLITTPREAAARTEWTTNLVRISRRIAAAAAILVVGVVSGRMSAGMPLATAFAVNGRMVADENAPGFAPEDFASTNAAMVSLQRAQQEYERAALYLANHDTSASDVASELLRMRLAALDEMAGTSLRALGDAPADPIMNQVYLTTLGARNMTLGRLATALPVGSRLSRF